MAKITQQELQDIIRKAPQGTDPKVVVESLIKRGHTIEGLDQVKQNNIQTGVKQAGVLEKISNILAPTVTKSVKKLASGEGIGARDLVGSALEIGSFLIPAGAVARGGVAVARGAKAVQTGVRAAKAAKAAKQLSLASRARQYATVGAKSGFLAEAGRATGEGDELGQILTRAAGGAALGGATGAVLPVAGAGISAVKSGVATKALGRKVTDLAENTMQRAIQINPSDIRKIMKPNIAGVTPARWLLERGLTGSRSELIQKTGAISRVSKSTVDKGLAKISQTYTAKEVPAAKQAIQVLAKTFKGTAGNEEIIGTLRELAKKKKLTLSDVNGIKRLVDRNIAIYKSTGDVRGGAVAKGLSNVRDRLKVFIEKEASKNGFKNVRKLNKETQVATEIRNAIIKKEAAVNNNRAIGLTDVIVGTVAGVGINPLAGLGIVVAKKVAEDPKVQTNLAKILYRLSQGELRKIESALLKGKANETLRKVLDKATRGIQDGSVNYTKTVTPAQDISRGLRSTPKALKAKR